MDIPHINGTQALALLVVIGISFTNASPATQSVEQASAPSLERISEPTRPLPEPVAKDLGPVSVPQLSDLEQEMANWARGLFVEANLQLPPVIVSFHDDPSACHGTEGRWEHTDEGADRVFVCVQHEKPHVQDEWRRRTLVHELAHAWAEENLDDQDREKFLALRDLSSWNDPADEWGRRGTEHAAEIVSWGVIDQKVHLWKLPDASCPAMATSYYLLTGMTPKTGIEESCR